ncbi:uncharacterized protein LOC101461929 [Ceratitis capitata]|uniref:Uncharacterized protein n=1 Tax=Ceratitis capitata TaxID=7213 RepID=W8BZ22_CERCA|nr:uncharacterized protein LOC101461929 [Ceratitis capitata]
MAQANLDGLCNALCTTEDPVPAYPLVARTVKKNSLPACDAFGPFPDETIVSSLDRALYLMGARRVQEFLHLPTPSLDSSNSDISVTVSQVSCPESHRPCRKCNTIITTDTKDKTKLPSCLKVTKTCTCPKCRASTAKTMTLSRKPCCCCCSIASTHSSKSSLSSHVQICEPPKTANPLKRSFSMCSLACRKLKQMLTFPPKDGEKSRWLWARLQSTDNGCQVYEIFKNSSVCTHPSEFEKKRTPQVIFVMLQNGNIMPFEILSAH